MFAAFVQIIQPMGLLILMNTLPPLIRLLGMLEGFPAESRNQLATLSRYFYFQVRAACLLRTCRADSWDGMEWDGMGWNGMGTGLEGKHGSGALSLFFSSKFPDKGYSSLASCLLSFHKYLSLNYLDLSDESPRVFCSSNANPFFLS